jgi:hypothetical protein
VAPSVKGRIGEGDSIRALVRLDGASRRGKPPGELTVEREQLSKRPKKATLRLHVPEAGGGLRVARMNERKNAWEAPAPVDVAGALAKARRAAATSSDDDAAAAFPSSSSSSRTTGQKLSATMDVVHAFPLPGPDTTFASPLLCEPCAPEPAEETTIVHRLRRRQAELLELETALEAPLRRLLQESAAERDRFFDPAAVSAREADEDLLSRYTQMMADEQAAARKAAAQIDEDMNAFCVICYDGEVTKDNQILFCDSCDTPMHQW